MCDDAIANIDLKIAVLNELSAAMRHQSQAEYLYVAAAIAGYGAICLGVGSLATSLPRQPAAIVAMVFMLALSAAIGAAIRYNHETYMKIRGTRSELAAQLRKDAGADSVIPDAWTAASDAPGVYRAYWILGTATAGAVAFCAALGFS
jgi:hypothetical protein